MPSSLPSLPNGIQNIALSFSGGGYRAAAFTLGCVSYLDHRSYAGAALLTKVKFISSASGGSITSLVLCSMLREGATFGEIYKHLAEQLRGCTLVEEVFKVWENNAAWVERPEKTRNFINAFSMIYDRDLFRGQTFDIMWQKSPKAKFVIEEICVNATEFNNGLNFRFGTKGDMGNDFLHFQSGSPAAKKIRLADILACSSCFTAGFEPVMFPYDFTYRHAEGSLTAKELSDAMVADNTYNDSAETGEGAGGENGIEEPGGIKEIGFMDGGIDDNQGIYAFTLADDRKKGYDYDLYMPCDVSSNYLKSPFRYPKIKELPVLQDSLSDWGLRLRKIRNRYIGVGLAGLVVSLGLLFFTGATQAGYLLLGFFGAALLLPLGLFLFVTRKVAAIGRSVFPAPAGGQRKDMFTLVFKKHLGTFFRMPLRELLTLLAARGGSVVLLATTIFLKKIRRVSYSLLFKEKSLDVYRQLIAARNKNPQAAPIDAGRLWNDHIAMTAVYQLSTKNAAQLKKDLAKEPWEEGTEVVKGEEPVGGRVAAGEGGVAGGGQLLDEFLLPSAALRAVVDIATEMGTTLWFDPEADSKHCLESLLAAGQATICFNLLRVSYRFGNQDKDWLELRAGLVKDWARFKEAPYWLYNEYLRSAGLAGFGEL